MYFGESGDAFTPLCRFLDRWSAMTREDLRDLGCGLRMVGCALTQRVIRRVAPGLYVDARRPVDGRIAHVCARVPEGVITLETAAGLLRLTGEWFGTVDVALPRRHHFPRTAPVGLRCARHGGAWTEADVVTVAVPGPPGIAVRCFRPLRTFGELAAAGHVDTAGEVGRALVGAGERPEALVESMIRLGVTRSRAGDVMFVLFAGEAHRKTHPEPSTRGVNQP